MAKINKIIQPQGYEIIRDELGAFIKDELFNQVAISYDEELDADVYVERFIPIGNDEVSNNSIIVISLAAGKFDNFKQLNHDGNYLFNIDFYTNAKSTNDETGDVLSTFKLHKLMGVVKSIIMNPIYDTLNFNPPFVMGRYVEEMNIEDPKQKEEATNVIRGRLTLNARCVEKLDEIDLTTLKISNTGVKISNTDKGYLYEINADA